MMLVSAGCIIMGALWSVCSDRLTGGTGTRASACILCRPDSQQLRLALRRYAGLLITVGALIVVGSARVRGLGPPTAANQEDATRQRAQPECATHSSHVPRNGCKFSPFTQIPCDAGTWEDPITNSVSILQRAGSFQRRGKIGYRNGSIHQVDQSTPGWINPPLDQSLPPVDQSTQVRGSDISPLSGRINPRVDQSAPRRVDRSTSAGSVLPRLD